MFAWNLFDKEIFRSNRWRSGIDFSILKILSDLFSNRAKRIQFDLSNGT